MALNPILFSADTVEWGTPDTLFKRYNDVYSFSLDVCASPTNTKVPRYYSRNDSCLNKSWAKEICWMNPPYGSAEVICKKNCKKKKCEKRGSHCLEYVPGAIDFVRKAAEECDSNGVTTVMLLPARTDTKWFHKYILNHSRTREITFLPGRVRFVSPNGNKLKPAPFPSMVVVFGP